MTAETEDQDRSPEPSDADYAVQLEAKLARARSRPIRLLADLAAHRMLTRLARLPFVPESVAARFARSAAKRDPLRDNRLSGGAALAQGDVIRRLSGARPWRPDRPTVILTAHDFTLTGAPVVTLNLAATYAESYNVIVVALAGGTLQEAIRAECSALAVIDVKRATTGEIRATLAELMQDGRAAFAIVNSVASWAFLAPLAALGIPIVTLVHEFAVYTANARRVFGDIARHSAAIVFSSDLTLADARRTAALPADAPVRVLPQGRGETPVGRDAGPGAGQRLATDLRPAGPGERRLVIGAGSVDYRKGVDLFIDCAARIARAPAEVPVEFVWFGAGYRPGKGYSYSAFLSDQIERAGLKGILRILPPTPALSRAFHLADMFLLTSRLDPYPNVAMDALASGVPVLCFEDATGIAQVLGEAGLAADCIVPYFDSAALADRVRTLANDPERLQRAGTAAADLARARFDFAAYAAELERLARAGVP